MEWKKNQQFHYKIYHYVTPGISWQISLPWSRLVKEPQVDTGDSDVGCPQNSLTSTTMAWLLHTSDSPKSHCGIWQPGLPPPSSSLCSGRSWDRWSRDTGPWGFAILEASFSAQCWSKRGIYARWAVHGPKILHLLSGFLRKNSSAWRWRRGGGI